MMFYSTRFSVFCGQAVRGVAASMKSVYCSLRYGDLFCVVTNWSKTFRLPTRISFCGMKKKKTTRKGVKRFLPITEFQCIF
jgi:hypothetical protein